MSVCVYMYDANCMVWVARKCRQLTEFVVHSTSDRPGAVHGVINVMPQICGHGHAMYSVMFVIKFAPVFFLSIPLKDRLCYIISVTLSAAYLNACS